MCSGRECHSCSTSDTSARLPLCLGVLKHRAPLGKGGGGGASYYQKKYYDGFLLMWCNFNILPIPKFPEHVCLTACVGVPSLPPSGPK